MSRTRARIVWGGWEGHAPREASELVADGLRARGFEVELTPDLDGLADLTGLDVVIPCWTMGALDPRVEAGLLDGVERGCGVAGWHGGLGDAFRASTGFQFMVGGQFVAHPGDFVEYRVDVEQGHPVTDGVEDFHLVSEQYYLHVDPAVDVHAWTTFSPPSHPWIREVRMPVAWTRPWGEGRVFYCSIGHGVDELRHPAVQQLILQGIDWAARKEVPA